MRLEYFQMIDRVLALAPESITAEALVPRESPVFEGISPAIRWSPACCWWRPWPRPAATCCSPASASPACPSSPA
ncbi:hypothetical protein ACFQU2_31510 [Siccirubricoccus deserti]